MGTEVLRPHDCLIERVRVSPCRRRNFSPANNSSHYPNPRSHRKQSEKTDQRKRQQEQHHHQQCVSKRSTSVDDFKITKNHAGNKGNNINNYYNNHSLVMEKVTILRRGESLDSKIKSTEKPPLPKNGEMFVTSTNRLGPAPEMVPNQIKIVGLRSPVNGKRDMYAGSGFAVSPAPSSLPLPSFSKKKQDRPVDDSATRDLRRLLRLDI